MKAKLWRITKNTAQTFMQRELSVYAGYITLYVIMSFVPLLMIVTGIVNLLPFFNEEDLSRLLITLLPKMDQIRDLILALVRNLSSLSGGIVLSVSAVMALYSASRGVAALQKGLSRIYGIQPPARRLLIVFAFTLAFIVLLPALLVFHLLGDTVREGLQSLLPDVLVQIASVMRISRLITLGITVLLVVLTYAFLCGRTFNVFAQLPGALLTLVLGEAFSRGFAFFIPRFWKAAAYYGPLASIFIIIMWLRVIMTVLLLGAALNHAVFEERLRTKQEKEAAENLLLQTDYAEEE